MSFKLSLLLGVCWCMLTHLIAGAPSLYITHQSVEGNVPAPLEPTNDTIRTESHVIKRFIDGTRACQENYSRLDPRSYFNTNDLFVPKFVYKIECAGTPSNPPTCGIPNGGMRCYTQTGRVEFMRMSRRGPYQCLTPRRVFIKNVPVGCYCV